MRIMRRKKQNNHKSTVQLNQKVFPKFVSNNYEQYVVNNNNESQCKQTTVHTSGQWHRDKKLKGIFVRQTRARFQQKEILFSRFILLLLTYKK